MAITAIRHGYPFTFVEHEETRNFIKFLNAEAPPISRNTLKSDVIKVYSKEKEKLKSSLALLGGRICLTLDLWPSITIDEYMVITTHFVNEEWKLQKKKNIKFYKCSPTTHWCSFSWETSWDIKEVKSWEESVFTNIR